MIYSLAILSQDTDGNRVTVVEIFDTEITQFKKIKEIASFNDTAKLNKSQEFSFIRKGISSDYKFRSLSAAKVSKESLPDIFNKRLFFAFGSHNSKNIGLIYDNLTKYYYTYGLSLNYFDNGYSVGNIDASSSNIDLILYSKVLRKNNLFFINAMHNINTHYVYGFQEDDFQFDISDNLFKNLFAFSKVTLSAISNHNNDKLISHSTKLFMSDLNQGRENQFHASSEIVKNLNSYPLSFQLEFDKYINHDGSNLITDNIILASISPSIEIEKFDINFDMSIGLDYDSYHGFDVFPSIISEKEIVDNILIISAGLYDDRYRNTYKSLSDINPYIHAYSPDQFEAYFIDEQELRTTETKQVFFQVKNKIGKDEYVKAGLKYGFVENLPSFKNNYSTPLNMFLIDYQDVWQLNANLEYKWKINQLFEINFNTSYYNWGKDTVSYRSNLEVSANLMMSLRDKIKINTGLNYFGKSYAVNNNDQYYLNQLNSRFHINLDINYSYSKSLGAYLRFLNVSNSRNEIWLGYKEMGLNAHFGLSYTF